MVRIVGLAFPVPILNGFPLVWAWNAAQEVRGCWAAQVPHPKAKGIGAREKPEQTLAADTEGVLKTKRGLCALSQPMVPWWFSGI